MLMAKSQGDAPPSDDAPTHVREIMHQYGYSSETAAAAPQRLAAFLGSLAVRLRQQIAAGSEYLVGDRLSAVDLYWACFSIMVAPLSQSASPMAEWLRAYYLDTGPAIAAALDPLLITHRDRIYGRHIGLPLDY
jgi:glutathione S-transferase